MKTIDTPKQKQIDLLKKQFPYDEETHTFTVNLHYKDVSSIIDEDISSHDYPSISWPTLERLNEISEDIPAGESISVRYCIDDYEGYEATKLVESFNDAFAKNRFLSQLDKKKKGLIAVFLVLFGLFLLFMMVLGKSHGWFGDESSVGYSLAGEVIDISAWVFIWEAVTLVFLSPSEYRSLNMKILLTVSSISFYDGKGEKVLSGEQIGEDLKTIGKKYNIRQKGKGALLIAGAAYIAVGLYSIYKLVNGLVTLSSSGNVTTADLAVQGIVGALEAGSSIFAGIAGILCYLDKPFGKKAAGAISGIIIFVIIFNLIYGAVKGDWQLVAGGSLLIIVEILYAAGYICTIFPREKKN